MNESFSIPVMVRPLLVTAFSDGPECAVSLCSQVCWAAGLRDGEPVGIDNLSTGRHYKARIRLGPEGEVRLAGAPDPDLMDGDVIVIVAHEFRPSPPAQPGAGTVCLCERNRVIEIRHWSAPALPESPPPADRKVWPAAQEFTD